MGMFDRLWDAKNIEWQTKAFGRSLADYEIGDELPAPPNYEFQVEVLGGREALSDDESVDGFALIRDRRLVAVPVKRDESLPLLGYDGIWQTSTNTGGES